MSLDFSKPLRRLVRDDWSAKECQDRGVDAKRPPSIGGRNGSYAMCRERKTDLRRIGEADGNHGRPSSLGRGLLAGKFQRQFLSEAFELNAHRRGLRLVVDNNQNQAFPCFVPERGDQNKRIAATRVDTEVSMWNPTNGRLRNPSRRCRPCPQLGRLSRCCLLR